MDQDEIHADTWEDKQNEWMPYLKIDVLSKVFCYARYSEGMEEMKAFGTKNSSTLASLANKKLSFSTDQNNEPIYIYNDEYRRSFVPKIVKVSRCVVLNQYHQSYFSDEVFNKFSTAVKVKGNICKILD